KALTMKFVPPDTCLKDYKKRRSAFLMKLSASTPNVSARAKEFRRWIDENSPYSAIATTTRAPPRSNSARHATRLWRGRAEQMFAAEELGHNRRVLPRREVERSAFAGAAWQLADLPHGWPPAHSMRALGLKGSGAPTNKCLANINKSRTGGVATKKRNRQRTG